MCITFQKKRSDLYIYEIVTLYNMVIAHSFMFLKYVIALCPIVFTLSSLYRFYNVNLIKQTIPLQIKLLKTIINFKF